MSATVAGVLGALTAVGGLVGYVRKGSVGSLAGGLVVGASYLYSAVLLNAKQDAEHGRIIAIVASALLGIVMGLRYFRTLKPMPLVLTLVGVLAFTYFAVTDANTLTP